MTTPASPTPPPRPFDEQVMAELRDAMTHVFLKHPEVGALAVVVNWRGALNDAKISHGLWLSPQGPVTTMQDIIGSIGQTLKMFDFMLGQAARLEVGLRERVTQLGKELVALHEQKAVPDR